MNTEPLAVADLLRGAMDAQGITDPTMRAGIAAIAMGESALSPHSETSYANTANSRIRGIFGRRVSALSDEELDRLKADPRGFFNHVYGGTWGSANLGNILVDDGYLFRGRGLFQLTGRGNYIRFGRLTGHPELVTNPDLANDPRIAAAIAVAYMKDRYKGGGWDGMKRAVGNSIGNVDARKNALYQQYLASGEFAAKAPQRAQDRPDAVSATAPAAEGGSHASARRAAPRDGDRNAADLNRQELDRLKRGGQ